MKNEVETIEEAPSWKAVLPIYLMAIKHGKSDGRHAAVAELERMANLADLYVASKKGGAK